MVVLELLFKTIVTQNQWILNVVYIIMMKLVRLSETYKGFHGTLDRTTDNRLSMIEPQIIDYL